MRKIRECKAAQTCPALSSRSYYFEPNPDTAPEWQASGRYLADIDRRVVFVCESPGPQFASENQAAPSRCWTKTAQDERFLRARQEYGFADCYITNSVKCGVRRGARYTDDELSSCRGFLVCELQLLQPLVAVGVGANAYRTLRRDVLPVLDSPPVLFQITHYSARGDVWARWKREFSELERLLGRLKPRSE
jgi:uracil-DNA glycosylase family 4